MDTGTHFLKAPTISIKDIFSITLYVLGLISIKICNRFVLDQLNTIHWNISNTQVLEPQEIFKRPKWDN